MHITNVKEVFFSHSLSMNKAAIKLFRGWECATALQTALIEAFSDCHVPRLMHCHTAKNTHTHMHSCSQAWKRNTGCSREIPTHVFIWCSHGFHMFDKSINAWLCLQRNIVKHWISFIHQLNGAIYWANEILLCHNTHICICACGTHGHTHTHLV